MKNSTKSNTNLVNILQLVSEEDVEKQFGSAMASIIATDQVITWAKFILTDDKPNVNGQRVPAEEFDNLIKTGVYKPIKMALGEIKDGHEDAKPIGVITNLTKEGNKVVALAALWDHEREEDVAQVKEMVNSNKPVNVSWEIFYGRHRDVDGISDLLDTILRAVTIVGMPAYAGRTQLLAVAAKKWSPAYIEKLPDENFLHIGNDGTRYFAYRDESGKIDPKRFPDILEEISSTSLPQNTLKVIRHQVNKLNSVIKADAGIRDLLDDDDFKTEEENVDKELEIEVADLKAKLAVASEKLTEKEAELTAYNEKLITAGSEIELLKKEIEPLREFKSEADNAAERDKKLSMIREKFISLKLDKAEEYFVENADKLLGLDESGLDFMLQEMVAFKEQEGTGGEGAASKKKTSGVPNVPGEGGSMSISDLAAALRERNKK